MNEENQKTVSVKGKVATQANEEQIIISKVDIILKITDEMERVLKNGGDIPKEYNSGDGIKDNIKDYIQTIPDIMDVDFYEENDKYSIDELNEKLQSNGYTLKIAYGWKKEIRYGKGEYITSISTEDTNPYYLEFRIKIFDKSDNRKNDGNVILKTGSPNISIFVEKKNENALSQKGNGYQDGYWNFLGGLETREKILKRKYVALHNHSWEYKQDTQTSNKILAYCTQPEYKDGCSYQGKDHALTLNLDASDMEYTGKEYDKASVTNNISSITGATCGEIYYEGTNYESTTPPTNPGTYTASVTLGGVTATKNFTISKLDSTYTALQQRN